MRTFTLAMPLFALVSIGALFMQEQIKNSVAANSSSALPECTEIWNAMQRRSKPSLQRVGVPRRGSVSGTVRLPRNVRR